MLVAHVMGRSSARCTSRPRPCTRKGPIMNDQEYVDLDREAVYDSAGWRITEDYVTETVDAIAGDDVARDEDATIYPSAGADR